MTSRTRRLLAVLSTAPIAVAITMLGSQAANAPDHSGDGNDPVGGVTRSHSAPGGSAVDDLQGVVEDTSPDSGEAISDRRVKRDITPVDWSR
jgi:hypothetical protein